MVFVGGMVQLSKDLEYGRVPSKELVLAVHEMLSAAGINMDVEKQSLLQTTLTLKEKLEESQAAFLLEQVSKLHYLNTSSVFFFLCQLYNCNPTFKSRMMTYLQSESSAMSLV